MSMATVARLRIRRAVVLAINALPAIVLAVMGYSRRWVAEDAFIDFRVIEHLLAGHGPVFNAGERVEAYTNPLWMAVLALWKMMGGSLEAGSVELGLVLSVGGLVAAQAAAYRVVRHLRGADESSARGIPLPLGGAVFAAVPVVWDFATSGMETGLSVAWLGVSFWLLAWIAVPGDLGAPGQTWRVRPRAWYVTAAILGLGPLIRPDLAIFSAGFVAALGLAYLLDANRPPGPSAWALLALAVGLPTAAYEVFRMGYFAALVPNTALAKEAGLVFWSRGWLYAVDFGGTYALWVPLVVLYALWSQDIRTACARREWSTFGVLLLPAAVAAAHAGYVIRVGGDFMHGRLLLPSLFAGLLPVMTMIVGVSHLPTWRALANAAAVLVVAGWSITCAAVLRLPYTEIGPRGVADERECLVHWTHHAHPMGAADFAAWDFAHLLVEFGTGGSRLMAVTDERGGIGQLSPFIFRLSEAVGSDIDSVADAWSIGVSGYTAGLRVHIVDRLGLADPIAARLRLENRNGRPGHEKWLAIAWIIARFAEASATPLRFGVGLDGRGYVDLAAPATRGVAPPLAVTAARAALACGDLAELVAAVEEPISVRRFLRNLRLAWRLHRLRIASDPLQAQRELCARLQR